MINLILPDDVNLILSALESHGFSAYTVGGCVRDTVMNKTPNDWDICTSASPTEIAEVFNNYRVIKTGIRHGTVTVVINNRQYEITTFRIDGEYLDNRRPESVLFTSDIKADLSRRDFTINAMAYSHTDGLLDFFGGLEDIEKKIIRCVGEPKKRFGEDALRIMRAIRFSSVLNFKIDSLTADAIFDSLSLLKNISSERLFSELLLLLNEKNVYSVLDVYRSVIAEIIPEVAKCFDFQQNTKYHIYDVWRHTAYCVSYAKHDPIIRLTMLLHDIEKPQCYTEDSDGIGHFKGHANSGCKTARRILKRLHADNYTITTVSELILYHDIKIRKSEVDIKRILAKIGTDMFNMLLDVQRADAMAKSEKHKVSSLAHIESISKMYSEIILRGDCFNLKTLAVNGKDIKNMGFVGETVGNVLEFALNSVIENSVCNNHDALVQYIENHYAAKK